MSAALCRIAALSLAVALPGGSALGQSLGELAESTKKKRKGGTPVYTDDDLKQRAQATGPSQAASGPAPAAAAGATGGGDGGPSVVGGEGEEGRPGVAEGSGEAHWRRRAETHRLAMQKAEQRIAAAQSRINALLSDVAPSNLGDPFREQTREAELGKARQELQAAEEELETAEDAFHAFEEEARRKAIPPGWLEER